MECGIHGGAWEFVGFIDHPTESVCDLLAYETLSKSSSELASEAGSSGYHSSKECFVTIAPNDTPEAR